LGTSENFSDENPSVHLRRALVRRLRYLRGQLFAAWVRRPKETKERYAKQHYGIALHPLDAPGVRLRAPIRCAAQRAGAVEGR
jgi:hypothetical protein